jgi:hypothetical protein
MLKHQFQTASHNADNAGHAGGIASSAPDADTISRLAYQLWSERGRPEGSPEVDWLRAEHLLRAGEGFTG